MTYRCNDCSYSNNGRFPNGKCPACGSFNIYSNQQPLEKKNNPTAGKWRIAILITSWIFLSALLYQKFLLPQ